MSLDSELEDVKGGFGDGDGSLRRYVLSVSPGVFNLFFGFDLVLTVDTSSPPLRYARSLLERAYCCLGSLRKL